MRKIGFLVISLVLLSAGNTLGGNKHGVLLNTTSPIGFNLDPVNYYDGQFVFTNLFQQSQQWGFNRSGLNGAQRDMALDSNGWLTSSYRGISGTIYPDGVGVAPFLHGLSYPVPTRTLNVSCTGVATLKFAVGASGSVTCPATNAHITTTSTSISELMFNITGMDLTANGSYLTALSIVRSDRTYTPGNYSTYFNPDYLRAIQYARVLRMVNWDPWDSTYATTWTHRATPAQPFYGSTTSVTYGNGQIIPSKIPLELEVSLADQLGASLWSNLPCRDDGTFATNYSGYVSAHLNGYWYAEFCNEIWNLSASQSTYARIAGAAMFPWTITGITLGNPTQISFSLQQGQGCNYFPVSNLSVTVEGIVAGPTQLNGNAYMITGCTGRTVSLNVNTTGDTAWSSGGVLQVNNNTGIAASWGVQQSAAEMDLVKAAWTASTSRLFRVYGAQAAGGSPNTTSFLACGSKGGVCTFTSGAQSSSHFDVIAYAPYEGYGLPISWSANAQGVTNAFTEMNVGGLLPTGSDANTTTNTSNAYVLSSSPDCGNGSIASTPANQTLTCAKINATCTGQPTLTVDGGTTYNVYYVSSRSGVNYNACTTKGLKAGTTYDFEFVTQTGAAAWASTRTYSSGAFVSGSDNNTYLSLAGSNLNHNPVGDGNVHWQVLTPAWFVTQNKGQTGGFVANVSNYLSGRKADLTTAGASVQAITSYEMGIDWNDTGPNALQSILYGEVTTDARMQVHYNNYYLPAFAAAGQTGIIVHYSSVGDTGDNGLYPFRQGTYGTVLGKELGIIQFIQANPKASLP